MTRTDQTSKPDKSVTLGDETTRTTPDPKKNQTTEDHREDLLDEALEETFPSSDPISPKHIT